MRLHFSTILFAFLVASAAGLAGQAPAEPAAAQTVAAPAAGVPANTASSILQPALLTLQQAIDSLHTDKWKAPVRLRDETDGNIRSIRRDVDTVLPPLLAESDKAPDSVVAGLPVLRNIEALYDVLLRVAIVGKTGAPAPQSAALDGAMSNLDDARRALGDRLQTVAAEKEKQVRDLQAALKAVPPPPAATPVVASAPAPEKKRTPRKKPAPKPVASPTARPAAPATQP